MAVGNIGALRAPPYAPAEKATEFALALISGWAKGDKEKFGKILKEMQDAAKHNAEVYAQGSAVLNELSRKDKELRELDAATRKSHEETTTMARTAVAQIAAAKEALAAERAQFVGALAASDHAAGERQRALTSAEATVKREKAEVTRLQHSLTNRIDNADRLAEEAQAIKSRFESRCARLKAIIEE